jgi:hypothetical protein
LGLGEVRHLLMTPSRHLLSATLCPVAVLPESA